MVHSMQPRDSVATGGGNRTNRKLTRVVFSVIGTDFRFTIQTVFFTDRLVSYTGIEKNGILCEKLISLFLFRCNQMKVEISSKKSNTDTLY